MENNITQLQLQEQLETLSDGIINTIEVLEAQGIHHIVNNDFNAVQPIIDKLETVNKTLMGGDGE